MATRRASHANSWYSGNGQQLDRELTTWLAATTQISTPARAVICPHAGYSYSGATAAHSFRQIDPNTVKTIFILGPSHHVRLSGCAVSQCTSYQTPLGDLTIDREITNELMETGQNEDKTVRGKLLINILFMANNPQMLGLSCAKHRLTLVIVS